MDKNNVTSENRTRNVPFSDKIKKIRIYAVLTLIFTVAATVAGILVLKYGFNYDMGVFASGNMSGRIMTWVMFILSAVLLSSAFTVDRTIKTDGIPPCSSLEAFFSAMSGGLIILYSVFELINCLKTGNGQKSIIIVMLIMSVPAGLYLIFNSITVKSSSAVLTWLGFFPVLWIISCLMKIYFDRTSAINNPVKIFSQVALIAIMLYFLMELRIRVGKPNIGYYTAMASLSMFLGISYSVPVLFVKLLKFGNTDCNIALSFAFISLGMYAFTRLVSLSDLKEPSENNGDPSESPDSSHNEETEDTDTPAPEGR